jgi:hypothetical protein
MNSLYTYKSTIIVGFILVFLGVGIFDSRVAYAEKKVQKVSFPENINTIANIPKIIIVNQKVQWFGAYENGILVQNGPVSSGKKSTPTPNGLFHVNWKGKRVVSSDNSDWILKWNMNIENKKGISLHQYALPGYPASHSCVRLTAENAKWLYHWVDTWVLSRDGKVKTKNGTPVIIYGAYDYKKVSPSKILDKDLEPFMVSEVELDAAVHTYFK